MYMTFDNYHAVQDQNLKLMEVLLEVLCAAYLVLLQINNIQFSVH
jgi:hypothetical protein